jgi:hypothetical protein
MNKRYNHHKYTWTNLFGSVQHDWRFSGLKGGLNFHASVGPGRNPSCGLEFHSTTPLREDTAPDHLNCPVTGGRCWHDGTSLYATEHCWPIIESYLRSGSHDLIFKFLEHEADSRFYPKQDDPPERPNHEAQADSCFVVVGYLENERKII